MHSAKAAIKEPSKLPASIRMLGWVSLLMDVSSEMIHSLLPVFMVSVLGATVLEVGWVEGLATSTALMIKIFSGTLSDFWGRRKSLVVIGYGLSAMTKPLFVLAPTLSLVVAARLVDRLGKGVRGAPRDALIADLVPEAQRGAAFGLRQSMDTAGAILGPLLAVGFMVLGLVSYRGVFAIAVVPAFFAVLMLILGVKEPPSHRVVSSSLAIHREKLIALKGRYLKLLVLGILFSLARFSEAFLLLDARQAGLPIAWVPMVMVVMNVTYASVAYPAGRWSDQISRDQLLWVGLLVLIAADMLLASSHGVKMIMLGAGIWGIHLGLTQGVLTTMVADAAPAELRGTALGVFNAVCGVSLLIASVVAGYLWSWKGSELTFYTGAAFCVLALVFLGWIKERQ